MNNLKNIAKTLPQAPGVYIYKDSKDNVLYVGKAKNLRKRVQSYFSKTPDLKTKLLLENARNIEYTVAATEMDALALEDQLINQHKPRYNILLKNDSSYRYICITRTNPPQIIVSRKPSKKHRCFGPYPFAVNQIAKVAKDILGLTKYKSMQPQKWDLYLAAEGMRKAGSQKSFSDDVYQEFINKLVRTIKHGDSELIGEYQSRMQAHAAKEEFEQALQYKNKIELLQKISGRTISSQVQPLHEKHLVVSVDHNDKNYVFVFQIRQGLLHFIKKFTFDNKANHINILSSFIKQYYHNHIAPKEIIVHSATNKDIIDPLIPEYLSNTWNYPVQVNLVEQHSLIPLAMQNIYAKLNIKSNLGNELKKLFNLKHTPEVVDFIDISNVSDAVVVGGTVRFVNEEPQKSLWRHYTIKTVVGQDDFASISEVVSRRYKKIPLPDILIIDGGAGQRSAAASALPNANIPIVGLAKKEETLVFEDGHQTILNRKSVAGKFIIKGRDTIHKFVIEHSRTAFKKVYKKSFLDNIPGIGPSTKFKLLTHFESTKNIKSASFNELAKVVGKDKAKKIKNSYPSKNSA